MKKVFIIHGFEGAPNGGWRPWLMAELDKYDIYACALAMKSPSNPLWKEWVGEVERVVNESPEDEIYLVGHSLGVPTILRYLENSAKGIEGAVLVSGPILGGLRDQTNNFFDGSFDFKKIKTKVGKVTVIHGENDTLVPKEEAFTLSKELGVEPIIIPNGGHLNGSAGWKSLPQALNALLIMMN